MKKGIVFGFLCLAVAFHAPPARAQGVKAPVPGLSLSWRTAADSLVLEARVSLPAGWYINSDAPLDSFLVPTRIEVAALPGAATSGTAGSGTAGHKTPGEVRFGPPRWPAPVVEHSPAMGGDMSLFKESFTITVAARPAGAGKAGSGNPGAGKGAAPQRPPAVRAVLHYQSCDGTMCWPPKTVSAVWEDGRSRQE